MTVAHVQKLRSGAAVFTRFASAKPLLIALALLLLVSAGCAKHPSATAPVGFGKASGEAISNTARSNIGVRYKIGGTNPSTGFDCSGLVIWTYGQYGISMPRTAREQMSMGASIRKDQLRPGDLVVFKISSRRGYHTGIYSGHGKFVHSPSSGKTVREEALNAEYWQKRFVGARRIVLSP